MTGWCASGVSTTGELLAALDGRTSWLPRIAFSADGRTLVAAGSDNHIRVWDMDDIGGGTGTGQEPKVGIGPALSDRPGR